MKDDFLATVSHELRTPLSAILLWGKMLEEGRLDENERATAIGAVVRGAETQRQLVEDLLDVSRMITGNLRVELREIDAAAAVRAAVARVRPTAEAKGVALDIPALQGAPLVVRGDSDRLQQVLWNVLANAVKFTPKGGRVALALEPTGEVVRITVRDNGRGIAPDFLPHLFERFRQQEGGTTRTQGGLGLGLSIVRELVGLHGGEVRAESAGEGQGATFTVELPLAAGPPSADAARARPANAAPAAGPLGGVRLLLVEDDPSTQQALCWVLEAAGADVKAVASTPAALDALAERWPDVLVTDIGLPGADGYALLGRVRALAAERQRAAPPALALTAFARGEDRARALDAGFEAYAAKPIEPTRLVDAVVALTRATST